MRVEALKKLSVIVPVYNVKDYLEVCVESLLRQSYTNLEILLVDDGSIDGSADLCDELAKKDARILAIHQKNGGVSSARNTALEKVTGEYITFMDPDDWIEEWAYQTLIRSLEQQQADAVFCGYWEYPDDPALTPILHAPEKKGVVDGKEATYQCLIGMGYGYFTSVWNKLFRTDCLRSKEQALPQFQCGLSIGEDELWLTQVVPNLDRVVLLPEPLYYWRQRTGSALHDTCKVTQKWYTALQSKKKVVQQVEGTLDCLPLARGKVYCDLFHLIWFAYYDGDTQALQFFKKELKPYKKAFFKSKEFSKEKKIRFALLQCMVTVHAPRKWVYWLGEITSYRLKEKIRALYKKGE